MVAIVFLQQDGKMADKQAPIIMEEVTDPKELAQARAQWARFDRNTAWLQPHAAEIYPRYRGKCICIAGEELFVADTPEEVHALAQAAYPEADGFFLRYIPREKVARIYANKINSTPCLIATRIYDEGRHLT